MKPQLENFLQGVGGNLIGNAVAPGISGLANDVGFLHGVISNADPSQDAASWVPGVAGSRDVRYRRALSRKLTGGKVDRSKVVSERIGGILPTLAAALAGGAIGGGISYLTGNRNKDDIGVAAAIGAGVGGLAPHAIASLAALISRTRTKQEQASYENSKGSTAANWLLPGASTYNDFKSRGYMYWGDGK